MYLHYYTIYYYILGSNNGYSLATFLTASKHFFPLGNWQSLSTGIIPRIHNVFQGPEGLPGLFWILAIPYTQSVQRRLLWQKKHQPPPHWGGKEDRESLPAIQLTKGKGSWDTHSLNKHRALASKMSQFWCLQHVMHQMLCFN